MAILLPDDLTVLRQQSARDQTVDYTKAQINAALQAIEDFFEANRGAISAAINTATAPYVFTAAQKRRMVAYWLQQKFGREGV